MQSQMFFIIIIIFNLYLIYNGAEPYCRCNIYVKTINFSKDNRCLMDFPLQHPINKQLQPVIKFRYLFAFTFYFFFL